MKQISKCCTKAATFLFLFGSDRHKNQTDTYTMKWIFAWWSEKLASEFAFTEQRLNDNPNFTLLTLRAHYCFTEKIQPLKHSILLWQMGISFHSNNCRWKHNTLIRTPPKTERPEDYFLMHAAAMSVSREREKWKWIITISIHKEL